MDKFTESFISYTRCIYKYVANSKLSIYDKILNLIYKYDRAKLNNNLKYNNFFKIIIDPKDERIILSKLDKI